MPNTIIIDDYIIKIIQNNHKNMYIGVFTNASRFPKLYGDSINEIIDQAEELIKEEK